MPSIALSTGSVHYSEQGERVAVVLLHANSGDSKDFEVVIPALAKRNRAHARHWPGYGRSDAPRDPGGIDSHAVLPSAA